MRSIRRQAARSQLALRSERRSQLRNLLLRLAHGLGLSVRRLVRSLGLFLDYFRRAPRERKAQKKKIRPLMNIFPLGTKALKQFFQRRTLALPRLQNASLRCKLSCSNGGRRRHSFMDCLEWQMLRTAERAAERTRQTLLPLALRLMGPGAIRVARHFAASAVTTWHLRRLSRRICSDFRQAARSTFARFTLQNMGQVSALNTA